VYQVIKHLNEMGYQDTFEIENQSHPPFSPELLNDFFQERTAQQAVRNPIPTL